MPLPTLHKLFKFPLFGVNGLFLLLSLSLALSAAPHLSRNYAYRYFSTRDGLAQMQVMCTFQDKDGYIWFGTKGGVSRFDGISFKNYTPEDGLPFGETVNISEWGLLKLIFTQRKMAILFPNDSIVLLSLPPTMRFDGRDCHTIPLDKNRIMLLGLSSEIDAWKSFSLSNHFIYDITNNNYTRLIGFDETITRVEGNSVYTYTGIFDWDGKRFVRKIFFPYKTNKVLFDKRFTNCAISRLSENEMRMFAVSNGKFDFMWERAEGTNDKSTWLPDGTFLYLYNGGHAFFPKRASSLNKNLTYPNFSYVDRENNLWIGTENGLYNYFNLEIEEYDFDLGEPDNIWSIVEDAKGIMWFGSYGKGLWTMDKSGKLTQKTLPKQTIIQNENADKLLYMGSAVGNENAVYMNSCNGVIHFENGRFKSISSTPAAMCSFFDKETNQILYSGIDTSANARGLFIGMNTNMKFYPFDKGFPVSIAKDAKGRIRVGAFRGTGVWDGSKIITDSIKRNYTGVVCMGLDNWGRLWKGTERGVYVELPNGSEFRVGHKQLSGSYTSLVVYKNKFLIVGGTSGFSIVDIRNLKNYEHPIVVTITYETGFTGLESGQNGIWVDTQGYVWLATALNVLKFNPENVFQKHVKFTPIPRIDGISFSSDNTNWLRHFFSIGAVKIASDNKFFRIDYIANSISAPKSLRFKYRLIGLSDKWSESVYIKSVSYTNIGFGKYRFEVQCSLDGTKWSSVVQSPEIVIMTPWWAKLWFVLLYLLVFVASIVLVTRAIIKRKQAKHIQEINRKKLENELQLSTLRSKIIPHFTKNVLSAIGHFAMTDKLKAGHYISVFSKFTGLTLANADKNYISLNDELEYIQKYLELEKMRFGDRFEFIITIGKNVELTTQLPAMTLHTYCDNAIRHGLVNKKGKGMLTIDIENGANVLIIKITDNGIGRKRSAELGTQGNGQGLKLIQAQLDFYNQNNTREITQSITDLENEQGEALGTKIDLIIPNGYVFG